MDENLELLEHIYKNSEMGTYTLTKLLQSIKNKENKTKKIIEDELKEYEKYNKEAGRLIKKNKLDVSKNKLGTKLSSMMGIKMEVAMDNSDSAISHMLIEGITMGIVDISSKIDNYKDEVDKKVLKLAKDYLKFQQEQIEILKEYL